MKDERMANSTLAHFYLEKCLRWEEKKFSSKMVEENVLRRKIL
jgi:hypothetical protein